MVRLRNLAGWLSRHIFMLMRYAIVAAVAVVLTLTIHPISTNAKTPTAQPAAAQAAPVQGPTATVTAEGMIVHLEATYLMTPSQRAVVIDNLVSPAIAQAVVNQYNTEAPQLTTALGLPTNVDDRGQAAIVTTIAGSRLVASTPTSATVAVLSVTYAGTNDCTKSLEVRGVNRVVLTRVNGAWKLTAATAVGTPQVVLSPAACLAGALKTLGGVR